MKIKMTIGLLFLMLFVTACATPEKEVYDTASIAEEARATAELAIVATQTAVANQPTATPIPATEEAVVEETEEVTDMSDDSEDMEASEDTEAMTVVSVEDDPLFEVISNSDIANGEMLFNFMAVPACSTCHNITEDNLVGPGQYNILSRTTERIENGTIDEPGPYSYIYNSIINPGDYIVEGFPNAMPDTYEGIMPEQDIYDLVAYLASLGD